MELTRAGPICTTYPESAFQLSECWDMSYLLDLHNLRVEGVLRQIANPHSEKRMELILEQLTATMAKSETNVENKNEDEDKNENKDEVSFIYYEDHCSCSKAAKCKSNKCICFIRGQLCSKDCHSSKSNCCNK